MAEENQAWLIAPLYLAQAKYIVEHGFPETEQQEATTSIEDKLSPPVSTDHVVECPAEDKNESTSSHTELPSTTSTSGTSSSIAAAKSSSHDESLSHSTNIKKSIFVHQLPSKPIGVSLSSTPVRPRSSSLKCNSSTEKATMLPFLCRHESMDCFQLSPSTNNSRASDELSEILFALASFLFSHKHICEATEIAELSLAEYRNTKDKTGLAQVLYFLGALLNDQGKFDKARTKLVEALEIYKSQSQENDLQEYHLGIVAVMNKLGWLLKSVGEFFEARTYFSQALAIQKKMFENRHEEIVGTLSGLGSVLVEIGNLVQAREYFAEALSISMQHLGSNHPNVAQALNNIGNRIGSIYFSYH